MTLRQTSPSVRPRRSAAPAPSPTLSVTLRAKSTTVGTSSGSTATATLATGFSVLVVSCTIAVNAVSSPCLVSEVVDLPRLLLQLVAELRVGYGYEPARPFPYAAAA